MSFPVARPMRVVKLVIKSLKTLEDENSQVNLDSDDFIKIIKHAVEAIYGKE